MNFVDIGEYIIRVMCIIIGIVLGLGLSLLKEDKIIETVTHSYWFRISDGAELQLTCSHCGYEYIEADPDCTEEHNYCPHCGAKMDEEQE